MWGQRQFLPSSSSEEEIPAQLSVQEPILLEKNENKAVRFIAKPPSTRPITANARIISIQRAKLLKRGQAAERIETSPFFRSTHKDHDSPAPCILKKPLQGKKVLSEEIEEIKIEEAQPIQGETKIKEFWTEEKANEIITHKDLTPKIAEIAPKPNYSRLKLGSSDSLRERPKSQLVQRRNSKEFKAVTTVHIPKPPPNRRRNLVPKHTELVVLEPENL